MVERTRLPHRGQSYPKDRRAFVLLTNEATSRSTHFTSELTDGVEAVVMRRRPFDQPGLVSKMDRMAVGINCCSFVHFALPVISLRCAGGRIVSAVFLERNRSGYCDQLITDHDHAAFLAGEQLYETV